MNLFSKDQIVLKASPLFMLVAAWMLCTYKQILIHLENEEHMHVKFFRSL